MGFLTSVCMAVSESCFVFGMRIEHIRGDICFLV
jgi:hypothetical protein